MSSYKYFDLSVSMDGEKNVNYPKVRKTLIELAESDQKDRECLPEKPTREAAEAFENADKQRREEMLSLLEVCEPTAENIGMDGSRAVWLLAQHADLETMQKILKIFRKLYKIDRDSVFYYGIPFLIDRININLGKKQLYGTQFELDNGDLIHSPISDSDKVNERRADFGFPTVEEELKGMREQYGKQK